MRVNDVVVITATSNCYLGLAFDKSGAIHFEILPATNTLNGNKTASLDTKIFYLPMLEHINFIIEGCIMKYIVKSSFESYCTQIVVGTKIGFEHNNLQQTNVFMVFPTRLKIILGSFDKGFEQMDLSERRRLYFKMQSLSMQATDFLLTEDNFYLIPFDKTVLSITEQAKTGLR